MKPVSLPSSLARIIPGAVLCMGIVLPVFAQTTPAPSSQLQLQSTDAGTALAAAMSRLATSPRDMDALLVAGESALTLEDPRSALGFFGRADDISPNNGQVKAGLGRAMLQLEQVGDGLRLMEQAGNLGYSDVRLLADRGLARDLTGNQAGAQQDYAAALRLDPKNVKVIRRYAVSLGIVGQLDAAERTIKPLLYNSDRAAWRDRAFILAMNGKTVEAEQITTRVMPKALADAIKPYMERLAMLSPGQRAAAVHLGQFPPGLVNMRVASTAVPVKTAEAAPPAETAKGSKKTKAPPVSAATSRAETQVALLPPPPLPESREQAAPVAAIPAQPVAPTRQASPPPAPTNVVQGPPAPERQAQTARPVQPAVPRPRTEAVEATQPARQAVPPPPTSSLPSEPTPPSAEPDRSLAQIMAEIKVPEAERQHDVVPVNLAEIAAIQAAERKQRDAEEAKVRKEAARKKAEEEAKAKAAAEKKRLADNPARYWVQIGVGRDKGALAFTLRRMKKEHDALAKYDGWSAAWARTNRLVVGPFSNLTKAKAVLAELEKAGSDAFVWRSEAGEELEAVGK